MPPELLGWLGLASIPHINVSKPLPLQLSEAALDKLRVLYAVDFLLYGFLQAHGGSVDFRDDALCRFEPLRLAHASSTSDAYGRTREARR